MNKTRSGFNWADGYYQTREFSRSFDTIEDAKRFAEGKDVLDIFRSKGKYKVLWIKRMTHMGEEMKS